MSENKNTTANYSPIYLIISVLIAMIGYHIHHSFFWSIVDFFFWPFAILKWIICGEINMTIIKETFEFFFK